jgi:4-amino-4-deoxy-L-arabinose transferase-like glycosyltransferase
VNGLARRRDLLILAGITTVALLLRVALIVFKGNRYYFGDTAEYASAAYAILGHGGLPSDFPRAPLYPAFMALGFLLGGAGNYVAVRALQTVLGLGVVALTIVLGRRIGSWERGRLAGLGAACAPTLIFTTTMLYPTTLYTLLLLGMVLIALRLDEHPGAGAAAGLGVTMGLAMLTDPIVAGPEAALLVWLLVPVRRWGARIVATTALAVVVAAAVVIPYEAWHRHALGSSGFFMAKAQYVLHVVRTDTSIAGGHAVRDTAKAFTPLGAGALVGREWRLLREQPRAYLGDYAREFAHFFSPWPDRLQTRNVFTGQGPRWLVALYVIPLLGLALVGLGSRAIAFRYRVLLLLLPVAVAATYALFFTQMRYRIPVEPLLLVLAGTGAERLWRVLRPSPH